MKEEYELTLDQNDLVLSMESPIDIDSVVRITKRVKYDDGYDLVTRDGEMQYRQDSKRAKIRIDIGGRPAWIDVSDSFAQEFEQKIEKVPEF